MPDESRKDSGGSQTETDPPMVLRPGAVAVIDALGFKGIWERVAPGRVLQGLQEAREAAKRDFAFHNLFLTGGGRKPAIGVRFFSDTIIVIGTVPDMKLSANAPVITLGDVVASVATAVMYIITGAVRRDPPLAYRGCIAAGQILAEDEFFVGGAIDEASSWADRAEAAVVWLRPSAQEALAGRPNASGPPPLFAWNVPLKCGRTETALVVNPLALGNVPGQDVFWAIAPIDELSARYMATFDSARVDVSAKRENTMRALEVAAEGVRLDRRNSGVPSTSPSRDPETIRP